MSKLFLKISLLVLLTLFPMRIIGVFDAIYFDSSDVARIKASEQFKYLDFLILGNSHSYAGIATSVFDSAGLKTYNLACPAAGPATIKLVLENYIRNVGTIPKNIILNIGPEMFTPNCDVFDKFPIHRYLDPGVSNEQLLASGTISLNQYFKLFIKSTKLGFQKLISKNKKSEDSLVQSNINSKGFAVRPGIFTDSLYKNNYLIYSVFKHYDFDKKKEKAFFDLFDYCIFRHIHMYLHSMPNNKLPDFLSPQLTKDYSAFLLRLETNKNIDMLVYVGSLPDSCYADIDHMNEKGATIYTRFLLQKIMH